MINSLIIAYFTIALISYLMYLLEFIMRWLIGFCTYTEYGMEFMPKFGWQDEWGSIEHGDTIINSLLWPLTCLFTFKYFFQTFNGWFYEGNYWNSNFWSYRHIILKVLTNKEKFQEQLRLFRIGVQQDEYKRRDGFKIEKLINRIWK